PAALLAGAIERAGSDAAEFRLLRVTVEFLRPVPIAPLEVSTEMVRAGKQVQRVGASLSVGGVEVARALGLRLRRQQLDLPEPPGEWLGLEITSEAHADGTGLAQSALSDLEGPFGRAAQGLVVAPRPP